MLSLSSPTKQSSQSDNFATQHISEKKLLIIMCGLPARGKSYISKRLKRWLNWTGIPTNVFNVGDRRRQATTDASSSFFDSADRTKENLRHKLALDVLDECVHYLRQGGMVAIHDATNTTEERREMILRRLKSHSDIQVIFVESICNDTEILSANIQMKQKSPDYVNVAPEQAKKDFLARLANYEAVYQSIPEDSSLSYVKVIDVGRRVIANEISGLIPSQVVMYLLNSHIKQRVIFLTRHGQSEDNVRDQIGGDSSLTPAGVAFAQALNEFVRDHFKPTELEIWTSTLQRAMQTSQPLQSDYRCLRNRLLNEIDGGICEGLTYSDIDKKYPDIARERHDNKLAFRYPGGGESYLDIVERLKPIIVELERVKHNVLIVSHRAVIRTLLAYFQEIPLEQVPHLDVPLNQVIRLQPTAYGVEIQKFDLSGRVEEIMKEGSSKRQKTDGSFHE